MRRDNFSKLEILKGEEATCKFISIHGNVVKEGQPENAEAQKTFPIFADYYHG